MHEREREREREAVMEERELRENDERIHENGADGPSTKEIGDSVEEKLQELLNSGEANYTAWTSLVLETEKTSLNDIETVRKVYDAFLLEFPLCYGYWKKYASYMAYHCSLNEVDKVYERATEVLPYCIDLWVSFCSFAMLAYEDPTDIRRLFERGLSFVNTDYSSHLLWDKYIEFEDSQKQWNRLAYIHISALRFPSKKLDNYYTSFKELVATWQEELGCKSISGEVGSGCENTDAKARELVKFIDVISSFLDKQDGFRGISIMKQYLSLGELLYNKSSLLDKKINLYEARIERPYFHVKPLDDFQLENWHKYLDFVEMQGDLDWIVKLYERCLIPCANYSEIWIRYVEFAEANGGREIANHALDRAQLFFKRDPDFKKYCSMFKKKIAVFDDARASFLSSDVDLDPKFIENVGREANRQRRMGKTEEAFMIYEKAVEMAKTKQNVDILSMLYTRFAQFTFAVSGNLSSSLEVFMKGIQEVPCKLIIREMLNFLKIFGGSVPIPKLQLIIMDIICSESKVCQALSSDDREEISSLFIEFVDLHEDIDELRKAWVRHWRLFPHLLRPKTKYDHLKEDDPQFKVLLLASRQTLDPSLKQSSGGNGRGSSRTNSLDCQSPEDNHVSNQEEMVTDNFEGDENNENGRMEQIEFAEVMEKQSTAEGTEDNQVSTQEEMVTENFGGDNDDENGKLEQVEFAEVMEKQSTAEGNELHEETKERAPEGHDLTQISEPTTEYPEVDSKPQSNADQDPGDELRPPIENLSIKCADDQTQQSNSAASPDPNIPPEASSKAIENVLEDDGNSAEVSAKQASGLVNVKPSTPSQLQSNISPLNSACDSTPLESSSHAPVQIQDYAHSNVQQASPVNVAYSQNASNASNWPQIYYDQSSQSQQWQIEPQMQYAQAGTTGTQMVAAQGYPYQSQVWTGTIDQQANQTVACQTVATAGQVYPVGGIAWPAQSVQQHAYAYVQVQPGSQPQPEIQAHHQSALSTERQYGYVQNGQGVPPHLWQYYQQPYYHLQQQQQTQQLQNNPQQGLRIDQLQQTNIMQQQQLNQQITSQQEQNHQPIQQQQQTQLAQYHEQNNQVNTTQQYQQLLYMQQQQQHQLYMQQQQQLYLQQQQLLQQQQFQQLTQQQQQLILQQQQQLLLQQQQQQCYQLQQQHQQQLQQLQQQPIEQQKQISASEPIVISNNYTQIEGGNLQNALQSGSSSHPQTPQNR